MMQSAVNPEIGVDRVPDTEGYSTATLIHIAERWQEGGLETHRVLWADHDRSLKLELYERIQTPSEQDTYKLICGLVVQCAVRSIMIDGSIVLYGVQTVFPEVLQRFMGKTFVHLPSRKLVLQ